MLDDKAGRMAVSVTQDDYPTLALREGVGGRVEVQMGFTRDGVARSCRPVSSTNTMFLANVTCAVMLRRARFVFAEGAPAYDGLRYRRQAMHWTIP